MSQCGTLFQNFVCRIGLAALVCTTSWTLAAEHVFGQGLQISAGRKLAPDALNIIPPSIEYDETFQGPVDMPFVVEHPELEWDPNYMPKNETLVAMGRDVVFRGRVHCLEFAFKPVRMIEVDVQTPVGPQRKLVWYMVYRVRYLGGELQPKAEPDQYKNEVFGVPEAVSSEWVRFIPSFTLDAKGLDSYLDQAIPSAMPAIEARERVALSNSKTDLAKLHDSVEMQQIKIKRSSDVEDNPVWGVAMWTDVSNRTDFFSVDVRGLTNSQEIELEGRELTTRQKTLVLHFSRVGDTVNELEDRIRYGIPALEDPERQGYVLQQYGVKERLDYMWVYR